NRLIWVRPRSEARFFSTCRLSSTNSSDRSSSPTISSRDKPSIPNRCRRLRTKDDFCMMFIKAAPISASRRLGKGPGGAVPSRSGGGKYLDAPAAIAAAGRFRAGGWVLPPDRQDRAHNDERDQQRTVVDEKQPQRAPLVGHLGDRDGRDEAEPDEGAHGGA